MYSIYVNDVPVIKPLENPPEEGLEGFEGSFQGILTGKTPQISVKFPWGSFQVVFFSLGHH